MKKTVFIGGGNMAFAILGGLLKTGVAPDSFHVIDPSEEAAAKMNRSILVSGSCCNNFLAAATARLAVTEDFPTPPLPDAIPTTRVKESG